MNSIRNRVQLIGKLGANPEIKALEGKKRLARFNIATNESYKNNKGEKVTETQWHTIIAWDKNADLVEKFLEKGKDVAIEGKLINRNYVDKDGVKKYIVEIQMNEMVLLGKN
jgi:single-strand DNA-binding protein